MAIQSENLEKLVNKSTNTSLGTSNTLYPTQNAVKSYVDALGIDTTTMRDVVLNIMLNAFRIAQQGALTLLKMIDGFLDEYEDESGVDLVNSINQLYNSTDDYYSPSSDEIDSYTKLLLHGNGTNGSQTITDEIGKSVTAQGNAQISTSIKKFGTGSIYFDGTGDYLTVPYSADWDFGTGDFTIDFWYKMHPDATQSNFVGFFDTGGYETTVRGIALSKAYNANTIGLWVGSSPTSYPEDKIESFTFEKDVWYHIEVTRASGYLYIFVNGTQLGSPTANSEDITGGGQLSVGAADINSYTYFPVYGYIDEFRVSKGIARHTSNFTPSVGQYPISDNMTLISEVQVAESVPTSARIIIFEEDVDSITLNTDLKAYISRDGGTTYSQVTLEDEGNYITSARVLSGIVDISGQPSGSNVVYKLVTDNLKQLKIHGTGISWK